MQQTTPPRPAIARGRITAEGRRLKDELGRVVILRGVNLGGSSKVPSVASEDPAEVSYVGRPFPLAEAPEHLTRLRSWGLTTIRLIIMWEAVEHRGPGEFDEEYLTYVHDLVALGEEHGFRFVIDLHQDFYSRATGGDGAPYWTVQRLGLGPDRTNEPGAPHEQPPRGPGYWPPTAARSSVNTMDTLFWAGDDFAPGVEVDGTPVQHWLQDHFVGAVARVAERLTGLPNVLGYDTYNEPNHGLIGVPDLRDPDFFMAFVGKNSAPDATPPSYWDLMLAASGFEPEHPSVTPNDLWIDGAVDLWRRLGVWDVVDGKPTLLDPGYFATVDGRKPDHARYVAALQRAVADAVHAVDPDALILQHPVVGDLRELDLGRPNTVSQPHWYDGVVLMSKHSEPDVTLAMTGWPSPEEVRLEGRDAVLDDYRTRVQALVDLAEPLGGIPTLIGETGIPYDLNDREAYRSGDFHVQEHLLDLMYLTLDRALVSYLIWNYTADNSNERGDGWNNEDLSIFSPDQVTDSTDIDSGGRALAQVVRPYPVATAGEPLELEFDPASGDFRYRFAASLEPGVRTVLFVPGRQYPAGFGIEVEGGEASEGAAPDLVEIDSRSSEVAVRITRVAAP